MPDSIPRARAVNGEIELAPKDVPRIPTIDIEARCGEIGEPWSPVDLATVNDQVIRMALFHGEYHWHRHEAVSYTHLTLPTTPYV